MIFTGSNASEVIQGTVDDDTLSGLGGSDSLVGDAGNDVLNGGAGNDSLNGGDGVDTASYADSTQNVNANLAAGTAGAADAGDDTLSGIENVIGGSGNDLLRGDAGANLFVGGDGHDILFSLGGNDTLQGGGGDDAVAAGTGDNVVDGGDGIDRVVITGGTAGITIDLRIQGVAQATGIGDYTLFSIEQASATRYDDVLIGNDADNWLWGGSDGTGETGDDTISGMGGDDLVQIGSGDHLLDGGDGQDALSFQGNNTDFTAGVTVSLLLQGAAQDTGQGLMSLANFENLSGTAYADTLTGDAGDNILAGYNGGNSLSGGAGDDILRSNGSIRANTHNVGSAGPITVNAVDGFGADTLDGGSGEDLLDGGYADDILDGGDGVDTATYADAANSVSVNLALGRAIGVSSGNDTLSNIENVIGSAFNDTLAGDDGSNVLTGGAGDDHLDGGDGLDVAVFSGEVGDYLIYDNGSGSWVVDGPDGVDQLTGIERLRFDDDFLGFNTAPAGMDATVSLNVTDTRTLTAASFGFSDADGDALGGVRITTLPTGGTLTNNGVAVTAGETISVADLNLNRLVFTPSSLGAISFTFQVEDDGPTHPDINATLDATPNTLTFAVTSVPSSPTPTPTSTPITSGETGSSGDDVATFSQPASFSAGAGADVVTGSTGDDRLQGNTGNDTLSGGVGNDAVYGGADNDQLRGDEGDDFLSGDLGSDTLSGGVGEDSVFGGAGDDRIDGGAGEGYLRGGTGSDVVVGGGDFDNAHGNEGDDTVSGGGGDDWVVGGKDNDQLNGDAGGDIVYGNLGSDTVSGGEGDDLVRGGQDNDQAFGGTGNDWLSGDRGDDTVTGGAGADTFHTFSQAGVDVVTDFNYAEGDRIQLDPGTIYTVDQIGSTVLINMGGGNYMSLQNTQLASLGDGWIFGA